MRGRVIEIHQGPGIGFIRPEEVSGHDTYVFSSTGGFREKQQVTFDPEDGRPVAVNVKPAAVRVRVPGVGQVTLTPR